MTDKILSGRINGDTAAQVQAFTESVSMDAKMYEEDIKGSIAHARMLAAVGLISEEEARAIIDGLENIMRDIASGSFRFDPALEDVHMNIESELTKRIGEPGKKLHTARSRNDQVATDLRLFAREGLSGIRKDLVAFMGVLLAKADQHVDTVIPGMTHLQHAQGVSLAHHMLAYFEMMLRDHERIMQAMRRLNVSPLGSAALAGTTHPIDRFMTSGELGFREPSRNSIDSVSDRDFAVEAVFICAVIMMHLSRLAEEIIIWNSEPFSYVDLPDSFCTGSSIMPQKKNPDVAELVRGKVGGIYGNLMALLTMMKGLPLAYNRDLQEDKKPLFETLDTTGSCLRVMAGLMQGMAMRVENISRSLERGFITATDIADYLAAKGMPFRDAHRLTGEIVSQLSRQGRRFTDLTLVEFKDFSGLIEEDIFQVVDPASSVDARKSFGGTARENVRRALREAHEILEQISR